MYIEELTYPIYGLYIFVLNKVTTIAFQQVKCWHNIFKRLLIYFGCIHYIMHAVGVYIMHAVGVYIMHAVGVLYHACSRCLYGM